MGQGGAERSIGAGAQSATALGSGRIVLDAGAILAPSSANARRWPIPKWQTKAMTIAKIEPIPVQTAAILFSQLNGSSHSFGAKGG
jgi:hypothetical protein